MLFLILLVHRYGVPIPALDDWEMAPLIAKAHTGGLSFSDIFVQQQESRTFFPKLIFILLALGRYWDPRMEMMFSILICSLSALGIYLLLRKSALSAIATGAALFLAVLLIFSPAQQELWLLASGFPSFVPALCIVWGLVVVRSNLSIRWKFSLCLVLAIFGSFTLANGLLVWGLTFPILFFTQRPRGWWRWLAVWAIACGACAAVYFWDYSKPHDLPSFASPHSPLAYVQYLLLFLGSGLARAGYENPLIASSMVGAVLLLLYLSALAYAVFRRRDREYLGMVLPWLALGFYSIGSGGLAALGRIDWGVAQALESRYVAFSLYLSVAVIALVAIAAGEIWRSTGRSGVRLGLFTALVFLGAIYLTLDFLCAASSIPLFRLRSAAGRLGHGAVLFSQVIDTSETIRNVNYPRAHFVLQNADRLDRLHLLRTPLIRTTEINALRHTGADDPMAAGWLDGLTTSNENRTTAWGWAALSGKGRPADCVVLAYGNEKGEWIAFALSHAVESRPDVVRALNDAEQQWSGWRASFRREAVPSGAQISAWAVDAKDAKLYRLKESSPQPKL
ncbi:MAG TPA: hypothetical protein VN921_02040 [Chthoniobacterales bacterium]|nr:hypothetical protein [Chthoniobacterales bacterium]